MIKIGGDAFLAEGYLTGDVATISMVTMLLRPEGLIRDTSTPDHCSSIFDHHNHCRFHHRLLRPWQIGPGVFVIAVPIFNGNPSPSLSVPVSAVSFVVSVVSETSAVSEFKMGSLFSGVQPQQKPKIVQSAHHFTLYPPSSLLKSMPRLLRSQRYRS